MRVAIFTDTYVPDVNGVARTLQRWTSYLERRGVACKVFAPEPSSRAGRQSTPNSVERFVSFPFFLYPECRLAFPNPAHIRRAITEFRPDLIHVATPFNLGLCGLRFARKYGIPLIASYHTNFDQYLSFYNLQWMEKLLWRYMDWFHRDCKAVFVPSASTLSNLAERGWDAKRLTIWSRGVDTSVFHPLADREALLCKADIAKTSYLVLYAGRLAPEKDVETAIEAFARFQRSVCQESVFVIAGDGPSSELLKQKCSEEGVNARFIGFTEAGELQKWYAAADVMLFPSPTETFGNVVLEAMACGTPVIGADAGGVRDTIQDGVTGLLRAPGDSEAFAAALELLYREPETRACMGRNAHLYGRSRSWEDIFDKLLTQCDTLAGASERESSILPKRRIN
ncbi:glycosyltransferase family 1 protein [Paenibacillus nanensis]|uniref:Glycosyltransferase family 1 protein n=1 Tax=Paenibacillus nanensis TaxID=393251 RepID=A0A3A1UWS1_9BACL|nr:glycosyltransferase family 1 protein [Paenibacillus nanensis]RIX52724.1 glycosyltransferase family 1 protein [Paenibacillus nanensis]